jgi:glycosyltransferase involved in cell wall biosynthesis
MKPDISVILPAYNAERYIQLSINSVLSQSFGNFELIVINDGSTDRTEEIIRSFSDERINYIKNSENRGLSASYNIGVRAARGRYIARMDADDLCDERRFERQLGFMEKNPQVGIVGSDILLIDEAGRLIGKARKPASHARLKWASLFSTPLFHPSIMARTEIMKENPYDESLANSEDYELWSRLLFFGDVRLSNMRIPLLRYRVFPHSFTQKLDPAKRARSAENTIRNIEHYISLSESEKEAITLIRQGNDVAADSLMMLLLAYRRASAAFLAKEKPSLRDALAIRLSLISFALSLAKHRLRGCWR